MITLTVVLARVERQGNLIGKNRQIFNRKINQNNDSRHYELIINTLLHCVINDFREYTYSYKIIVNIIIATT